MCCALCWRTTCRNRDLVIVWKFLTRNFLWNRKNDISQYFISMSRFRCCRYGVEMDDANLGKNDGAICDKVYFTCTKPRAGLFVRRSRLTAAKLASISPMSVSSEVDTNSAAPHIEREAIQVSPALRPCTAPETLSMSDLRTTARYVSAQRCEYCDISSVIRIVRLLMMKIMWPTVVAKPQERPVVNWKSYTARESRMEQPYQVQHPRHSRQIAMEGDNIRERGRRLTLVRYSKLCVKKKAKKWQQPRSATATKHLQDLN